MMYMKKLERADKVKLILLAIIFAGIVVFTIISFPFFLSLRDETIRNMWLDSIKNAGIKGIFISLGLQISQVLLAVIPGEPFEIAMGYLYGTFGGMALCLIGIIIGTGIILIMVKLLGVSFVKNFVNEDKMKKFSFLHKSEYLEGLIFLLFFIPGTPKDFLTYLVPLTPIKPLRFLVIATVARIPSVITSTMIGSALDSQRWKFSILIFALTAVAGIAGIYINNKLVTRMHNKSDKINQIK